MGFGRAALIAFFSFEAFLCDRRHGASPTARHDLIIKNLEAGEVHEHDAKLHYSGDRLRTAGIAERGVCRIRSISRTAVRLQRGCIQAVCSGSLTSMASVIACLQQKKSQASPKCKAQYDAESR